MCILFIAKDQCRDYPLIIAANRDEFHERPTQSSHNWASHPSIFAGKDLRAGGTWLGVTQHGRIAGLTNIRQANEVRKDVRSRGELVVDFLTHQGADGTFQRSLEARQTDYSGFNLLYGNWQSLQVFNNQTGYLETLTSGIHGLSNGALNDPWPKVSRGVSALSQYCADNETVSEEILFSLLKDKTEAPQSALPDTGVPVEWEKRLSPIFIQSPEYGTRASTLILVKHDGCASWTERTFKADGQISKQTTAHFEFV